MNASFRPQRIRKPRIHQDRDNAISGAKIQDTAAPPDASSGPVSQKHRIHSETKQIRPLYDPASIPLKIIDPLTRHQTPSVSWPDFSADASCV
jgi:hypothetical protein